MGARVCLIYFLTAVCVYKRVFRILYDSFISYTPATEVILLSGGNYSDR